MKPRLCKHKECTGCGVCAASCNHGAISMAYNREGFIMPYVDENKCVGCHACENKCTIKNFYKLSFIYPYYNNTNVYTSWTKNVELCRRSSSGGVFAQLALDFLSVKDSFVVGVEQPANDNTCQHVIIEKREDIGKIIGTKYIQSDVSSCYKAIRKSLHNGNRILFVGTPCQVAGVRAFLGSSEHDENIFYVEVLCHGVTSKLAVDLMCKIMQADYVSSYRNKQEGWCVITPKGRSQKSQCCTYSEIRGNDHTVSHDSDIFYKCFGVFHRHSCYKCPFAQPGRLADITLGDQWGAVDKYKDRLSLGASLVIANTDKGRKLILSSKDLCINIEQLKNINAHPFFYPAVNKMSNLSWILPILRHMNISVVKKVMTNDAKHFFLLIPYKILKKIGNYLHAKKRNKIIKETQKKYEW